MEVIAFGCLIFLGLLGLLAALSASPKPPCDTSDWTEDDWAQWDSSFHNR